MSSDAEIREVYQADLNEKTLLVWRSQGPAPFYEGNTAMHIEDLFGQRGGTGDLVKNWNRPDPDAKESEDA